VKDEPNTYLWNSELHHQLDAIISFLNKFIRQYDVLAQRCKNGFVAKKARYILDAQAPHPRTKKRVY